MMSSTPSTSMIATDDPIAGTNIVDSATARPAAMATQSSQRVHFFIETSLLMVGGSQSGGHH